MIKRKHLRKIANRQRGAAEQGNPKFLPHDAEDVLKAKFLQRKAANNGHRGLTARIAARIHHHGNVCDQYGACGQRILKLGDDQAGKGGGYHQQQ